VTEPDGELEDERVDDLRRASDDDEDRLAGTDAADLGIDVSADVQRSSGGLGSSHPDPRPRDAAEG
jgi:hypothetical protein